MADLTPLTTAEAEAYAPLAFPAYRAWLPHASPAGPIRAFGVGMEGRPVGLILGTDGPPSIPNHPRPPAQIVSLFVAPDQRGGGLGAALLAQMEAALEQAGQSAVHLEYTHGLPTTPALEKILARRQWSSPRCWSRLYRIGGNIATARWLTYPLPAGFSAFAWVDLPAEERAALQQLPRAKWWWPAELSPFSDTALLAPEISLGLRFEDALVGWLIAHRLSPEVVRYTSLFVREQARGRLPGMALLAAGIRRHMAHCAPTYHEQGLFMVKTDNALMTRLAEKHLRPYCAKAHEIWGASKRLASSAISA
jgi:GNAT superfamily N-acetyltransferase